MQEVMTQIDTDGHDLQILRQDAANQDFWLAWTAKNQQLNFQHQETPNLQSVCPQIRFCRSQVRIGTETWQVLIPPSDKSQQLPQTFQQQLWLIRGLGLGITIILATYMAITIRQHRKIQQLVGVKTDQAAQLKQTLNELQATQTQLVQSAKMSSLGQLVAGIAHEINNPVNFIHGNLKYMHQYSQALLELVTAYDRALPQSPDAIQAIKQSVDIDFLRADLPKLLESMQIGTNRIREIVLSLRNFSRLDEADRKSVDLHEGIESTLMILANQLKGTANQPAITVVKQYGELPTVSCYPGLLNQVLINILNNAIDALRATPHNQQPQITIQTNITANQVQIGITDNGIGIREADQASLFNPFFTTKPVGEGTGLGLSIGYKIITEQHQGQIWAESQPGQGTTFWIKIPSGQPLTNPPSERLESLSRKSDRNTTGVNPH
ncbi:HAMP domain-containing histidine kinase [filamentous cyanobacterium LEGE 11480]|uniref:histidine kinase n=2 Tax=Romeriopsis TaxID=2992131 RepID=A0A928Z1N6_9CYAN|nr:HAMP domain-containing histidine kinase [Romeriopsis navalis LEGE 11480]